MCIGWLVRSFWPSRKAGRLFEDYGPVERDYYRRAGIFPIMHMTFNNMAVMLPWLTKLIGEDRDLLGDDWWPYGIAANRAAINAVLRYHHEQGLTERRLTIEEVFVPGLLDT